MVLTWRCFAIGTGETHDMEVGLASSTGETREARAARSGVGRVGVQWFRVVSLT